MTPAIYIAAAVVAVLAAIFMAFIIGWAMGYKHGHADGNSDGWRRRDNFQRDLEYEQRSHSHTTKEQP